MKVIFIKSHFINGRKQVMGQKANIWDSTANKLIQSGYVKEYSGLMNIQTKTDLFKPK